MSPFSEGFEGESSGGGSEVGAGGCSSISIGSGSGGFFSNFSFTASRTSSNSPVAPPST